MNPRKEKCPVHVPSMVYPWWWYVCGCSFGVDGGLGLSFKVGLKVGFMAFFWILQKKSAQLTPLSSSFCNLRKLGHGES